MNFLANCLTTCSLACGFISIIFSLEGHYTFSCWAILFSAIFDALDGQVARINPVSSYFGKELDSLVDVVSFGVAPVILGYIFVYHQRFYSLATLALFIYLTCSIMRLAKYNITPKVKMISCFWGLPTTIAGGALASFVLIFRKKEQMILPAFVPAIFLVLTLALAYLMVSKIRYLNLDGLKKLAGKRLIPVGLVILIMLITSGIFRKAGITSFTLFLIYLIFSPFVVKLKKLCD